jgi:hypothetical protein
MVLIFVYSLNKYRYSNIKTVITYSIDLRIRNSCNEKNTYTLEKKYTIDYSTLPYTDYPLTSILQPFSPFSVLLTSLIYYHISGDEKPPLLFDKEEEGGGDNGEEKERLAAATVAA